MYCEHCGKEITQGGRFCEHCGTPLSENIQEPPKNPSVSHAPPQKRSWIRTALGILALVLLTVGIQVNDRISHTLNLGDYIEVKVTGFSGRGDFRYTFDPDEALFKELLASQQTGKKSEFEMMCVAWDLQMDLEDAIKIEKVFEEGKKISNGDVVKLEIKVNKDFFEELGYYCQDTYELKYEVGKDVPALPEPVTINVFDYLDLSITGSNGNGVLVNEAVESRIPLNVPLDEAEALLITVESEIMDGCSIPWNKTIKVNLLNSSGKTCFGRSVELHVEKSTGFSNGESVKVSIDSNEINYLWSNGIYFSASEKIVTAKNLGEPVKIDLACDLSPIFTGTNGHGEYHWTESSYTVEDPSGRYDIVATVIPEKYSTYISCSITSRETQKTKQCRFELSGKYTNSLSNGDTVNYTINTTTFLSLSPERPKILMNSLGLTFDEEVSCVVSGLSDS